MAWTRPIRPLGGDRYRVDLDGWQRDLVGSLVEQLREALLGDIASDPTLRRLFPAAYPGDEAADAEYQRLMGGDLLERRLANLDLIEESIDATELSGEQMNAWLSVANDIRLVLGTRLDVSDDPDWEPSYDDDSPEAGAYRVYEFLGGLVTLLIEALMPE